VLAEADLLGREANLGVARVALVDALGDDAGADGVADRERLVGLAGGKRLPPSSS